MSSVQFSSLWGDKDNVVGGVLSVTMHILNEGIKKCGRVGKPSPIYALGRD